MSLNSLIISTLKTLGVPVAFQTYKGTESTYITFFEFNQTAHEKADDVETKTRHSIQVDVFSNGDYTALVQQVKDSLISVGFTRSMETEYYEDDLNIYHKILRFNYVQ